MARYASCWRTCFLFVRSTISQQPAGRFTPKFACERTLVPNVSSPLILVTTGVNREFLHFGGFWAISQQRVDGSTLYINNVETMSADVPPPPVGSIGPWGRGEWELNLKKNWGWSQSCIGQLPFLFFSALPNVVQYVGHRPTHILV